MTRARRHEGPGETCKIVDFDEILLDACPASLRDDVMTEARLLAGVLAPDRGAAELDRVAAQLSAGERDGEMNRAHARRLAAALRHLARTS